MKCRECTDYTKCVKESNLAIKRKSCKKVKTEYVKTNADRIRAMSDEELAAWIAGMSTICECCAELNECGSPRGFNRCSHGVEGWLKQPAE